MPGCRWFVGISGVDGWVGMVVQKLLDDRNIAVGADIETFMSCGWRRVGSLALRSPDATDPGHNAQDVGRRCARCTGAR